MNFSIQVGNGIGPQTVAPVRCAVFTISRADWSKIRCSNALRRIRIFCCSIAINLKKAGPKKEPAILNHSTIDETTPAPTVRPPSRIAKRKPSSIAIGAIKFTCIAILSPGITISVPSGRSTVPVTSVVRK